MYATALFAFTTLAAAAAVPRADYGSWTVTYSDNAFNYGYHSKQIITAYNNTLLSDPIPAACDWVHYVNTGRDESGCSPGSFSYELSASAAGLQSLKLQQTVPLNGEQVTVYGEGEIELSCETDDEKTVCKGETEIPVSKAVA